MKKILAKIDFNSLRLRLTAGVAVFSILGLGSLASWTGWKMQQILIDSHKKNIEEIATEIPRDLQMLSEMVPQEQAISQRIDNLKTNNTLLWIENLDNQILAKSNSLIKSSKSQENSLFELKNIPIKPQVIQLNNRYFVLCSNSLIIQGKVIGTISIAQDITRDQTMFIMMIKSVAATSILVIVIMAGAIAFYIHHSLKFLRQLSQMTEVISAEDLGNAQLYFDNAPTEVKQLAETCNMMLSRLSESWEKERQFVSNVSHELRTPLTIVHGYLQSVLRRQQNLTAIQKEALETAASEAENTISLLQDLLELARADHGNLHFNIQNCILNDVVTEVVEMADKYSDRDIKIEAPAYLIEVKADYNRLKQILLNLIDNAVKYSEADTLITVKLSRQENEGLIQVYDMGCGIPLQHQSRIFERFYRVDEARNRAGGTGLGLSIVKTLVEGMGGKVSVRSKLSEGSVFTVSLPV
ncbi:two-component sensor histidine kinase [Plectonema cf. radiosum LEGE 06105]|uniref:histidine kinase n=1 Tax=Plectonema cf. radiosum LEGE 06105 TaxID=945769 RepID=A0A8J7F9A8_9CYAN|nr:ATP-binding protein [Plectonema radiosum]MBE9211913.1 two-component sensor histidine kinase [Plectonema cf. radiosum LEGE 06105]